MDKTPTLNLTKYGEALLDEDGTLYLQCGNCQQLFTTADTFRSHIDHCYGILKTEYNEYLDEPVESLISVTPVKLESPPPKRRNYQGKSPAAGIITPEAYSVTCDSEYMLMIDENEIQDIPEVEECIEEEEFQVVPAEEARNCDTEWLFDEESLYKKRQSPTYSLSVNCLTNNLQTHAKPSTFTNSQQMHTKPLTTVGTKNKRKPYTKVTEHVKMTSTDNICFQVIPTSASGSRGSKVTSNRTAKQLPIIKKTSNEKTKPQIKIMSTLRAIPKGSKDLKNKMAVVSGPQEQSETVTNEETDLELLELNIENEFFTFFKKK